MQTEVYFCLRLIRIFDFVEDTLVRQCSNKFDIALAYSHLWLHRRCSRSAKHKLRLLFALAYPYLCRSMNRMIDIFSVLGASAGGVRKDAGYGGGRSPCRSRKSVVSAAGDHPGREGYSLRDARTATARSVGGRISSGADAEAGIGGYGRQYSAGRFFDLLCVLASGHACRVKPSSKDTVLIGYVVDLLENDRSGYSSSDGRAG